MKTKIRNLKETKIMLICTTDNMIWQFLLPHIKDLQSYGATVDCICSKTGFWFDELRDKYGLNMIEIAIKRNPINLTNWRAYKAVKKLQKQNHYDLIYCQQPTGGMIGRFVGKKFHLPVIYTVHGFFFFEGNNKLKNVIYKTAEKYMAKYTTALITINNEDYTACQGWPCPYVSKINGIGFDVSKYDISRFDKVKFKESFGLNKDDQVILSVSEFIKRKNYPTMLQTFSELAKKRDNVKYVLCGTGILFEDMKKYAKTLGIENKVLFLGYRKDVNKIMQICDIFYHESFQEGLTMSIIEAMHFGLPVVTSNIRGNLDLIRDGQGGIVTSCRDIKAQVTALEKILSNTEMAKKMGEFNQKVVTNFYLETVRKQLKDIYKSINIL